MTLKVLIADDAADIAETVAFGVRMIWPDAQVTIAANGQQALDQFYAIQPDIVVLDVVMPPPDGLEVCRRIRSMSHVPIMMLTVLDTPLDTARALDLGADDFLTKPYDHLELLARLRALVRRAGMASSADAPLFTTGALTINFATREVTIHGTVVRLTSTEYRLLEVLAQHAGAVVPHQQLLEHVWGPKYVHDVQYVKVFVWRLRQKLGDQAEDARFIQTEWGEGYRLAVSHPQSDGRQTLSA